MELAVIDRMGYNAYFLIVWDFVKWARDNGIAVGPGRGSAAGSIVSYALRITDVDPLRYDLPFERLPESRLGSSPEWSLALLAAECYDRAQTCRRQLSREGLTVTNRFGELRPHPLVAVARDAVALYSRLLRQLDLDEAAEPAA